MRKPVMYLLLLILCSCNHTSVENKKNIVSVPNPVQKLKPIHEFKDDKTKEVVGEVYVNYINDTVFSSLYILHEKDTLYHVNKDGFFANTEKELEIYNENFFGYKLVSRGDDYISIMFYRNNGEYATDPRDIRWYKEEKVFGILRF